mgnify:CR=1 FL=1
MQHHKKMQDILNRIAIFDKLYDVIRLVDPTMKRVIEHDNFSNTSGNVLDSTCYYFWQRNQICDNCISIRAFNENTTYVKIEYNLKDIFMVTAIPYEMEERRVIIELIKKITDSMVFESTIPGKKSEVHTLIDGINILALIDSLTGLYNRRYISERLPVDLVSSVLAKQDISIIMADIDNFKEVNDKYGHLAGDKVLKMSSKAILNSIRRESDWVSRFGGEEFLICLPGAGTEKAVEIAEGIRKEIEAMEIDLGKQKIHITTSLGISSFGSIQGHTTDDLIEAADAKLYLAKNKGRNKVEY